MDTNVYKNVQILYTKPSNDILLNKIMYIPQKHIRNILQFLKMNGNEDLLTIHFDHDDNKKIIWNSPYILNSRIVLFNKIVLAKIKYEPIIEELKDIIFDPSQKKYNGIFRDDYNEKKNLIDDNQITIFIRIKYKSNMYELNV